MFEAGLPSLSARLRDVGGDAWHAATTHPMVREIAAGTLAHDNFRRYFEQNIAYLEDYARAVAVVTSKAPDAEALKALACLLDQIVTVELPANREFLDRLGGDPDNVRGVARMDAVTYAYTRHLLATASFGDCTAGLAAVLPCQWSYGEIGAQISGSQPDDSIYADWIEVFGNPEYAEAVEVTTSLLDRLSVSDGESFRRLQVIFDTSTRYEVEFWDMAYAPSTVRS